MYPHTDDPPPSEAEDESDISDPNWLIALAFGFEVAVGLLLIFYIGFLE